MEETKKQNDNGNDNHIVIRTSMPRKYFIGMVIFLVAALGIFYTATVNNRVKKLSDEMKTLKKENQLMRAVKKADQSKVPSVPGSKPAASPPAPNNAEVRPDRVSINSEYDEQFIARGQVEWISPKAINGPFSTEDSFGGDPKFYKVGKVKGGKYESADICFALSETMGGHDIIRYLDTKEKVIILEKYSDTWQLDNVSLVVPNKGLVKNEGLVVEELSFPDMLYGPEDGQVLKRENQVFFFSDRAPVREAFENEQYGTVWTTDPDKINRDEYDEETSWFNGHGFYIEAPDGTTVVYSLLIDKASVLDITWNNGTKIDEKEKESFSEVSHQGCGMASYASVSNVEMDELVAVGKNSAGETIYEQKDRDNEAVSNYYDGRYWAEGKKMDYEDFIEEHLFIYWVDPFGRLIVFENGKYPPAAECGKPVIYLYPEQTTDVSVKVSPTGGLTYTEPVYNGVWNVTAQTDGKIINKDDNKEYPYLFWEGRGGMYVMPRKGFIVERENLNSFLDEKLGLYNFNEKEIADFKEFWLPRMEAENKPYYFVTFMSNRYMDEIAPLDIQPQPDTVIRVLMDYRGLDEKIDVEPLEIKAPDREGFTVMEWGGVINK